MDAPKCKLCGERHYGLCGLLKPSDKTERGPLIEPKPLVEVTKPKFDRNAYHRAYMREYMRKRRAKKRKEHESE